MRRRVRAALRLLRCVAHGFHGLGTVLFRFPRLSPSERQERIRCWSAELLRRIGVELRVEGTPHAGGVVLAVNHVSWLDVAAVHAVAPQARFVSKADVRSWPLVARLVDSAGTFYLERERKRDSLRVVTSMAEALRVGQTVALFPESTTSSGHGLLPFHANLLQAAVEAAAPVQPVALRYRDSTHAVSEAVEFVGNTTLATSLWQTACGDGVVLSLAFLPTMSSATTTRRELAARLRAAIAQRLGVA